jgi:hypothetical protein
LLRRKPSRPIATAVDVLLLADENVPQSVVDFLVARGHDVKRVTDLIPAGSPDILVATVAGQMSAVVVTWDRDFRSFLQIIPAGAKSAISKTSRLCFRCRESHGRDRAEKHIDEIELAHKKAEQDDVPVYIEILETGINIRR